MQRLKSYVSGQWVEGQGDFRKLLNPATEEVVAETSTAGVDMKACLDHARQQGGAALRAMTFAERAQALKDLSKYLYERREELLELGQINGGNTRGDAKFDVDGATATLSAYAYFGKSLGENKELIVDGEPAELTRNPRYAGLHIQLPRRGAAVHINAYNFPAWGLAEKAAVAWLAGVPVIAKPATSTALLAYRIAELIVESGLLPEGAFSFLAGGAGDLLDHMGPQDVVAFTGSSHTGMTIRSNQNLLRYSVPVNVEADSLNAAVLGAGVDSDSDTWAMALREIAKDVVQKTGQKCTAIRRVFVQRDRVDEFVEALKERLEGTKVGNPLEQGIEMGPLVSAAQVADVREGIASLESCLEKVLGNANPTGLHGVPEGKGFFVTPHIFVCRDKAGLDQIHKREVFGPVVNVIPYDTVNELEGYIAAGLGGLVTSVYSDDRQEARDLLMAFAPYHGRLTLGNKKVAEHSPGPGTVMPAMVHGGPGRAGGGEELGGLRGLSFYMQRTAIQGYRPLLERFFK